MHLPLVRSWAQRIGVSPSKQMMPLSFASILGGPLTLIGSASNLIVTRLYVDYVRAEGHSARSSKIPVRGPVSWELPASCIGIACLVIVSPKLLPAGLKTRGELRQARSYTVQMDVLLGPCVTGATTIESAGLRNLPGLFRLQIERGGAVILALPFRLVP